MAVIRIVESVDTKYAWYIDNLIGYDGSGVFLRPGGFYKRCHHSQADKMTFSQAKDALRLYNKRFNKNSGMNYYID